jgi:hypothetical protein
MFDLSSIKKTSPLSSPPRCVIHGDGGVGKTVAAAAAPSPVFLPTEHGLGNLEVDAFPLITEWSQMQQALTSLAAGGHNFRTVVIDSLDWLEPIIWQEICVRHGVTSIERIGYGKGYIEAVDLWAELLRMLDALVARSMMPVLICHSQVSKIEPPDAEAFTRYGLKLHRSAAAKIEEWADVIGHAFIERTIRKEDAGFNKSRNIAQSTGRRLLNVAPTPAALAKNRYTTEDVLPLDVAMLLESITKSKK